MKKEIRDGLLLTGALASCIAAVLFLLDTASPANSGWVLGHELGRQHVQRVFAGKIETTAYPDAMEGDALAVLEQAIPALGKKLAGFDAPDAVLTAPETRSSSPVRLPRDAGCASAVRGLYPCGEGAGYAGGITSAAVDGMRCAEALLDKLAKA